MPRSAATTRSPKRPISALGVDTVRQRRSINGLAPYWRLAFQPQWGRSSFEIGTFGMAAIDQSGPRDRIRHRSQDRYRFRRAVSVPHRSPQRFAAGELDHREPEPDREPGPWQFDQFEQSPAQPAHQDDLLLRSDLWGDAGLFPHRRVRRSGACTAPATGLNSANNSPNTTGWIVELDYIPFNHGGPDVWPWLNMKIGLQYIVYTKFNGAANNYDGNGRNAQRQQHAVPVRLDRVLTPTGRDE